MALKVPPYLPTKSNRGGILVVACNLNGLGALRLSKGFGSQEKFVRASTLSVSLISKWEAGNGNNVSVENFCSLAERLGMTPKELFKWLKNYQAQTRRTSSHSAAEWLKPLATSPAPSLQALPGELR
jgi:transcriptional regulator with XRE-family HTH domain